MNLRLIASLVTVGAMLPVGHSFVPQTSRPCHASPTSALSSQTKDLPDPDTVTEESIRSLFYLWNNALATGESRLVAKRYAKDAVLLAAISDEPRMDYDSIKEYYDEFLKKKPQKEIIEGRIRIGYGWAEDAGVCSIIFGAEDNTTIRARYSFVYVWEDQKWKILHHHSSIMPEHLLPGQFRGSSAPFTPRPRMTKERVQNLFQLYNDALDTEDAGAVARRFSKSALVFPTDSEEALSSPVELLNYIKEFLKYRPSFKILESYITIGPSHSWAKDMGTYELTLRNGESKSKIICRYSLDYALESDGQWKITHHQSTPIPDWISSGNNEFFLSQGYRATVQRMFSASNVDSNNNMSEDDVRALFQKWNEALQTQNSKQVARLYSQKAVMVPSVSCDTPRTDPESIKNFFDYFLLNQPQATVLQSFVTVHNHWCKDVGILEYALGNPEMGQVRRTVKERYSFLYVWEDEEWRIAHHHSSALPEGLKPNAERAAGKEPHSQNSKDDRDGGDDDGSDFDGFGRSSSWR